MVFFLVSTFLFIDLAICVALLLYFFRPLNRYQITQKEVEAPVRLDDVPTVSLCIPARNETYALQNCLQAAIASNYPKLEILVLDDCSQDRTSQIIRSFAHEGVRFVQGDVPTDEWLGKNNAYNKLVSEARGDYLVFLSVDTRIDPSAISRAIHYMRLKKASMISVLPERRDFWRSSVLFAPLRYFWQVVLPLTFNTPLATSFWVVRTTSLTEFGGFEKVKSNILAENNIASFFSKTNEYRFLIANTILNVWYEKKWSSQVETSIRLWYPILSRKLIYVVGALLAHAAFFVAPFAVFLYELFGGNAFGLLGALGMTITIVTYGLYALYFRQTHRYGVLGGVIVFVSFPYIVMQEIVLIIISFYKYKQGRVDWRGRNVCYPVQPKVN